MTRLDDITSSAHAAHTSLDEATSRARRAVDEADGLQQRATAHGWDGPAEAMSSASEALAAVAVTTGDAAEATREGIAALSEIADGPSSDQVATRLEAADRLFTTAASLGERASTVLEDARTAAEQSDAQVLSEQVTDIQEDIEVGLAALAAAVESLESERTDAASWGGGVTAERGPGSTGQPSAGTSAAANDDDTDDDEHDDLTLPSRPPDPHATPEGPPETAPRARTDIQEALRYQNEAAVTLACAGYRVRRLPRSDTESSPDFEIEGRVFDCYTPRHHTPADAVRTKLRQKSHRQAARFVLNLDRSGLDPAQIRRRLQAKPPRGVREVLAVRNGTVIRIWP
jgi:hypothetical protein